MTDNSNYNYKTLSLEQMVEYIEKNAPQDKAWFKSQAFKTYITKDSEEKSKYSHLEARKAFCERYMPEIIPVAKKREPKKSLLLENW